MSDEGKVLVDSSGNPLKGVGGIVLADRLYPMTVKCTATLAGEWDRRWNTESPSTDDGVWAIDWSEGTGTPYAQRIYRPSVSSNHSQTVVKYSLSWEYANYSALEIPWGRIASNFAISYAAEIAKSDGVGTHINPDGISARCAYSLSSQSAPSGNETVWDRSGWGELFSGTVAADKSGSLNLPPTPPSEMWFGLYFDYWIPTPGDFGTGDRFYMTIGFIDPTSPQNRTIVYNLAT